MKLMLFSTLKIQSVQRTLRFFALVSMLSTHFVFSFAFASHSHRCEGIYNSNPTKKTNIDKLTEDQKQMPNGIVPEANSAEINSILESLWKLYVDKQLASADANNKDALESTRAKASQLQQTYNKTITEAQSNIPDFKTVWNEFKKQKMLQQSQPTQQNAAEESRRRKLETEEEERRRLHEVVRDPVKNHRKAILHEIRPGSFLMGDAQVPTEITKPFAMMDIQFTQMMWARLKIAMGERDLEYIVESPDIFSVRLVC